MSNSSSSPQIRLPHTSVIIADSRGIAMLTTDGELVTLDKKQAIQFAKTSYPILCHAKATARYLQTDDFPCFDLLELYAFIRPAQFVVPTPRGLADALNLPRPVTTENATETLYKIGKLLLHELTEAEPRVYFLAQEMTKAGWSWGPTVLSVLEINNTIDQSNKSLEGFKVWSHLSEWDEIIPKTPAENVDIKSDEVTERLTILLGEGSEERPQQTEFAIKSAAAFMTVEKTNKPITVISEAGTGVGKTLGYIASASVWAEKNKGPVWISTFTRNLQRQLESELDRMYPDEIEKSIQAIVRKGRENYLCLLNLEQSIAQNSAATDAGSQNINLVTLGLVVRWLHASKDGDMVGGDFPAWLSDLMGQHHTTDLTDTRGECIYSACNHYSKCFIEKSVRRAQRAQLVIANHALILTQSILGTEDPNRPTRYVFDEGHHLFDSADSAFSAHFTGIETSELRHWIIGTERHKNSRSRGLRARIEDLISDNETAIAALSHVISAARELPDQGWQERLLKGNTRGPVENFLAHIREQVYAKNKNANSPYDIEATIHPPIDNLVIAAKELADVLEDLCEPVKRLVQILTEKLENEVDDLDTSKRQRIDAVSRSLDQRCVSQVKVWQNMLENVVNEKNSTNFINFISVKRYQGRDYDTGLHRHYIDPTQPFAENVLNTSHGALITSATLRDKINWDFATARTGLDYMEEPSIKYFTPSPFDYVNQTRIYIVTDIEKNDLNQLTTAYQKLMAASGGGVLGLFTSIRRLQQVHERLIQEPEMDKLMLLAQHVDPLDTGTLVDIFKAEENACLLGTDAIRDGIDVPGRALRLIIYDRVPWPRPTILHKNRKKDYESKNSGIKYDDILTRLKLKQAFGRLIRKTNDRGIFIMLDRAMPSRLTSAFPDGVKIQRLSLAGTIKEVKKFLIHSH